MIKRESIVVIIDMKKKLMFSSGIESKEYSKIISEIERCRETNKELLEKDLNIDLDDYGEDYGSEDVLDELIGWSSEELPNVPIDKLGKVSGFSIVKSLFLKDDEEIEGHEMFVGYFDDNPRFEGETDDMDFYQFIGFTDETIVECGKKIAKYWGLKEV